MAFCQISRFNFGILSNHHRCILTSNNQVPLIGLLLWIALDLLIVWLSISDIRMDPDLQHMYSFIALINFTVLNTCACTHKLPFTRRNLGLITHGIFMANRTFQHASQDFHVVVWVCAKAIVSSNRIIIDDTQNTYAHIVWIVPTTK